MTFAVGPARLGFPRADAATAHDEMKRLRNMLLAVGLEELQTPESYDASEGSDESDVPTTRGGRSKYMYFAFTDEMQAEGPIYIGIRLSYAQYFNTYAGSGIDVRVMEALVSRSMEEGIPTSDGALFSFSPGGTSLNAGVGVGALGPRTSQGDFVKFSSGCLFVAFGANAQQQMGQSANYWGPLKCSLFMVLVRTGKTVSAFMDRRGYLMGSSGTVTQTVLPADLVSPFTNAFIGRPVSVFSRAGHVLFDGGTPVVAPIFGRNEYDNAIPLQGVYTIPAAAQNGLTTGQIMRLDFTGEEKDYLYFHSPSVIPNTTDQGWLIEWE